MAKEISAGYINGGNIISMAMKNKAYSAVNQ